MGRPPKPKGEKFQTPPRSLGRVSDEDWETIQAGARESGETFTKWATEVLLRAAKRLLRGRDE